MMDRLQIVRQIQDYLDRTTITGAEAPTMVLCRQYMRLQEQQITAMAGPRTGLAEGIPPAPPSQVADTSGK